MARKASEDLETFIARQDARTLADILLELAAEDDTVRKRLVRLQLSDRPDRLAAAFRKTLTGWRRGSRFLVGPDARAFARELEAWVGQVERELLPQDPAAALELAEAFIESDATFFDRADDSDGCVGDAMRAGARLWLDAAARCETPASEWLERLYRLAAADEYGACEGLLRGADRLLDETALRQLVERFKAELHSSSSQPGDGRRLAVDVYRISGNLSLLAEALNDPDVHVRAVLVYSPEPDAQQKQDVVRDYLRYDRPADALTWLEGNWDRLEDTRQRLHAEALGKLRRSDLSASILRGLFERTFAVSDLQAWLEHLPNEDKSAAEERARELALGHADPATAAELPIEVGDEDAAEAVLAGAPGRLRGEDYAKLLPLAKALEKGERRVGATAVLPGAAERDPGTRLCEGLRARGRLPEATPRNVRARRSARSAAVARRVQGGLAQSAWAKGKLLGAAGREVTGTNEFQP